MSRMYAPSLGICRPQGLLLRAADLLRDSREVFTLLHEFLRIPPDSQWKVGILWNSMEFLWKAFGWSLSHLDFLFHGNSNFFPRNSDGNGWNPGASGNDSQWNPWDSVGIPLKFHWNCVGNRRTLDSPTYSSWTPDGLRQTPGGFLLFIHHFFQFFLWWVPSQISAQSPSGLQAHHLDCMDSISLHS